MKTKSRRRLLSFPAQGVILIVIMILLTSFAIGLPAIWLIREQLERQAWVLANQGSRMVDVLLEAQLSELSNLAILTSQRPTLGQLLDSGDQDSLAAYLETLRAGADLDSILICDREGHAVSQVGSAVSAQACQSGSSTRVYFSSDSNPNSLWLLSFQPVLNHESKFVVIGHALDTDFSRKLNNQTGVENLFLYREELVGGSLPDNELAWDAFSSLRPGGGDGSEDNQRTGRFSLQGTRYYAIRSQFSETELETIVLLSGLPFARTQQQLTLSMAGGILIVTTICSLTAILMAKRVSLPLDRLRMSALALRMGNLDTPVSTNAKVREIAEVSYALEDARVALRHTLKELRREKAWSDYMFESVVEGIVAIDDQSRVTFFSPGAERITGRTQALVIGKPVDDVFRLADRETLFSQHIPLPGARQEIVTILVNEKPLILEIRGTRLVPPEAGKARLSLSIRDISNEEAMRGLLGDFLANITHEFRTPLTALAVSIELLLDQLPELSQDELHELLVSNHLGVLSLQNLIDNLLEGASIEAGRFQVYPRPTELADVIREVVRVMIPLIEKNHHRFVLDLPEDLPIVKADPRRTSQVLVNLLSNAIKWGPQGTEILLSVSAGCNEVKVCVADQGPGVLPDQKTDLFLRFQQVQQENGRSEYGAGLGLSVVKAIVESQSGQVGVEDRQGGGAVFWFTIPVVELDSTGEGDDL